MALRGNRRVSNSKRPVKATSIKNITPVEDITPVEEAASIDEVTPIENISQVDELIPVDAVEEVAKNSQSIEIKQITEIDMVESVSEVKKIGNSMSEKSNNQPKYKGRLVLVTGDKGGTGKSVVARILLDVYRQRNIKCIAYECDQSNPQLYRYYHKLTPGVNTLKLNQRGDADALQDNLKQFSPQVSLVDMPAGAAEYFENLANDIFLFENAQRLGYRITMISVLSRVKESLAQLKRLVDFCGDRADAIFDTSKRSNKNFLSPSPIPWRGVRVEVDLV